MSDPYLQPMTGDAAYSAPPPAMPPPPGQVGTAPDLHDSWLAFEQAEAEELKHYDEVRQDTDSAFAPGDPDQQHDPMDASRTGDVDITPEEYLRVLDGTQQILIKAGVDDYLMPTADPDQRLEQRRLVDNYAREVLSQEISTLAMPMDVRERIIKELVDDIVGLGPIDELLQDPFITEVIVRGSANVSVERDGVLSDVTCHWRSDEHVRAVAQRIAGRVGRKVDEADPMCDARLPDGSRVNIILPPVSLIGPIITIRKFHVSGYTLDDLVAKGALNQEMRNFLALVVAARCNILISGSTGSGKTTLLKSLAYLIPQEHYVITIEDTDELRLKDVHPRVSPLEARPANASGIGEVSIRRLLRNSLRMRPDRIVVGECRGAEALDMLQAMNTGHEGSLTTCHANSVKDAVLSRIPTMATMSGEVNMSSALQQAIGALEVGVQITRDLDGSRRVSEISLIEPSDDSTSAEFIALWRATPTGWQVTGEPSGRVAHKISNFTAMPGPPQDDPHDQEPPE